MTCGALPFIDDRNTSPAEAIPKVTVHAIKSAIAIVLGFFEISKRSLRKATARITGIAHPMTNATIAIARFLIDIAVILLEAASGCFWAVPWEPPLAGADSTDRRNALAKSLATDRHDAESFRDQTGFREAA